MRKMIRWMIAYFILSPLVEINYILRENGIEEDKWYWADVVLLEWGFTKMPCYKRR